MQFLESMLAYLGNINLLDLNDVRDGLKSYEPAGANILLTLRQNET